VPGTPPTVYSLTMATGITSGIPVLRQGSLGPYVEIWQTYLLGQNFYEGPVTGHFDKETAKSTRTYQVSKGLHVDSVVGDQTWGHAMANGLKFNAPETGLADDRTSVHWPPVPPGLRPIPAAARPKLLGEIKFVADPAPLNAEAIRITNDFIRAHLKMVEVPHFAGIPGFPHNGQLLMHRYMEKPLLAVLDRLRQLDLLRLVGTFSGLWAPRLIRGSRTTLSNHAWGTALDLNAPYNQLGTHGARVGKYGSVRELVPTFNEYGFFWGGHFDELGWRSDPMHFELTQAALPSED
jgi:hypothetical protein